MLNGTPKVKTLAETSSNDHDDAGPNLAELSLKTGDRVWVKHNAGAGYYSFSYGPVTTFSGFPIWGVVSIVMSPLWQHLEKNKHLLWIQMITNGRNIKFLFQKKCWLFLWMNGVCHCQFSVRVVCKLFSSCFYSSRV